MPQPGSWLLAGEAYTTALESAMLVSGILNFEFQMGGIPTGNAFDMVFEELGPAKG